MHFTNHWDETEIRHRLQAAEDTNLATDLVHRVYTSQLIGQVPDLVMHGGGNTSCKSVAVDLNGEEIDVLCVKGSGWDLATIEAPGLPAVRLAPLLKLRNLEALSDEDMVNVQRANLLDSASPNPSVETLLHAFLPHKFVDHTHSTPFLTLANLPEAEDAMRELFGARLAYVPYVMPGFDLAKTGARVQAEHPEAEGLLLGKHGHFTWGEDAKSSYDRVIEHTNLVETWLADRRASTVVPTQRLSAEDKIEFMQNLRGVLAQGGEEATRLPVLDIVDSDAVLSFLERPDIDKLAHAGVATPDHVIRTKAHPMLLPAAAVKSGRTALAAAVQAYSAEYKRYFDEFARDAATKKVMLSPLPKLIWAEGIGLIGAGASLKEAQVITDLAEQNSRVMADGADNGGFVPATPTDLFDMEYWSLEQAKLGKSKPPAMQGRVVVVTGGAGAIGLATAKAFKSEGSEVLLVDKDEAALDIALAEVGSGVRGLAINLIDDGSAAAVVQAATEHFGGMDILVSNAGYAHEGAIAELDETSLRASFELNFFAHFRLARAVHTVMNRQGHGGQMLFNVSKQAVNPGRNFGAYGLPKATLMFLVRQLALEFGGDGIRVNGVNADRIRSGLLNDQMISSRSKARGISEADYLAGNLVGKEVEARHVADGFVALAQSHRTTGHILTIDGGNVEAALR